MGHAHLRPQRHVLAVVAVADAVHDELLTHQPGQARPQLALDEVQHQFQRGNAARTGVAVAVDGVELVRDEHPRKLFPQRRQVFPVDGGTVAVQQTGLGQGVAAGAQGTERHPGLPEPLQGRKKLGRNGLADIDATADEHQVAGLSRPQRHRGRQLQAVARGHRLPIQRSDDPFIDVGAE